MASFANMLPRVHIHVIARYKDDAYFPNPVWGEKLREEKQISKDFHVFYQGYRGHPVLMSVRQL